MFNLKLSAFEVKAPRISLIYFSEPSNIIYNIWNDVAFVSYFFAKLNAELNINFDLSESSLTKLSILTTYFWIIYILCVYYLMLFQYKIIKNLCMFWTKNACNILG